MQTKLYGAILGDLAGQPYEFKYKGDYSEFNLHDERSHLTDDTLMTLATAYALLNGISFEEAYKFIGLKYEGDYYGKGFKEWLKTPLGTKNDSYGNGCLMRISPIMYLYRTNNFTTIRRMVVESCMNSHNHSISISSSIDLADLYLDDELIPGDYGYKLNKFDKFQVEADKTYDFVNIAYYSKHAQVSVQHLIKEVVKCGGDTDTNASIIGELLNYKRGFVFERSELTKNDIEYVESKLDPFLLNILKDFNNRF